MFSRRAGWELGADARAEQVDRRRQTGLPVLDLSESNPTRCALSAAGKKLREALRAVSEDPETETYAPDPRGDRATRSAVAAFHTAQGGFASADAIVLTAGTSEAYAHLFRLLADPGERVLVPSPSYPLCALLAELEGVEAVPVPLLREGGRWRMDLAALEAMAGTPTRALLVVHPNNPTGSLADAAEVAALRRIARAHDLALVSDEVFAEYRLPAARPRAPRTLLPATQEDAEAGPLTFVLSGASKLLGLPQLKVGWMAVSGPAALRDEAVARIDVIADTFLSVSLPAQRALGRLLPHAPALTAEIATRIATNHDILVQATAPVPDATLLEIEGGWAAILRLSPGATGTAPDEDRLTQRLLDEHGVVVQAGWLFDLPAHDDAGRPAAHLVLSLLPEPGLFARGVALLLAALPDAPR